jgi:hypothetical protein
MRGCEIGVRARLERLGVGSVLPGGKVNKRSHLAFDWLEEDVVVSSGARLSWQSGASINVGT